MQENNKNILIATICSMVILLGWTWFYEKPRLEKKEALKKELVASSVVDATKNKEKMVVAKNSKIAEIAKSEEVVVVKNRQEALDDEKNLRVTIESESLHGSILLKGARFDDLTLAKYFEENNQKDEVYLLSPSNSKSRYFADFGFVSSDANLDLPTPDTVWKTNSKKLTPKNPITLSWVNNQNIKFFIEISVDEDYMFNVTQKIENGSNSAVTVAIYGRINRFLNQIQKANYILHEGFLGVFNGALQEASYNKVIEDGNQDFIGASGSWFGITDKYWLTSIIADENLEYETKFSHKKDNRNNIFDAKFTSQEFKIEKKTAITFNHHFFAGAKKVKLLDQYSKDYNIKLFDRAIDFGWFYFITKPFFFLLAFLNKFLGNFGLAILAMTVLVKLVLYPTANKSYAAMARMKKLQPKVEEIRAKFKEDKLAMNREIMAMYKREKLNPAAGCLPILIQIPIFFSLYKVIFVTLDMRHAPFYGWIQDLSAPDPTSIFNLFGLLPFEVSGILAIGIWPILMGITMVLQQRLSPPVADPTQAKVLKFMPYILTFVLASFPAGLVIYWTWNNLLSIAQQYYITKVVYKS